MKDLNKYKYYTSACGKSNGNFLVPLGFEYTPNIEESDVIIYGGGADIDPAQYGEEPGTRTYASKEREKEERKDFQIGYKLGKAFFGICRGHQLLCTLAGGKLIQHVNNHGGEHSINTFDGNEVRTNSIHHQMVNPYTIKDPRNYKILAWTSKRISSKYLGAHDKPVYLPWQFKEIEAIYFPKINAMGVQYHPEMMNGYRDYEAVMTWTQQTFMKFLNKEL